MTERDSSFQPTWQSVKGGLLHRGVLAAASKWLTVHQAMKPDELHGTQEPHLVVEADGWPGSSRRRSSTKIPDWRGLS
jgi:hypothetical protein